MNLLTFEEIEKGWNILLSFNERGSDKKPIQKLVFFPKIDDERAMKVFNNNHLNTTHNFGEIVLEGIMKFIPQEVKPRMRDSYNWVRRNDDPLGTNDNRRVEQESLMVIKDQVKKYPKTYVKTSTGWIPVILQKQYQLLRAAQKQLEIEKRFNEEFRKGIAEGNALGVLKKWTVNLIQPFGAEEKTEKEYIPVQISASGATFNYALLGR